MDPDEIIGERIVLELSCPSGERTLLATLILDLIELSGDESESAEEKPGARDVEALLEEAVPRADPGSSPSAEPLHATFEFVARGLRVTLERAGETTTRELDLRRG